MIRQFTSTLLTTLITLGASAQNSNNMNKQINDKAPVKCSKTIVIKASPEKVWSVLSDINHWDRWQPEISKPELKGDLAVNAVFVWKTGGAKITSKLHTVDTLSALGWTGKTFGMFAIHNWTIRSREGATEVLVNESMQGFLAGLFKKSFNSNLEKGMQYWLEALKAECEK